MKCIVFGDDKDYENQTDDKCTELASINPKWITKYPTETPQVMVGAVLILII